MKNILSEFDILKFTDFDKVLNQYESDFIKNSGSVKILETETEVFIAVKKSVENVIKHSLEIFHKGKSVNFIEMKNSDFEEFVGRILQKNEISENCEKNVVKEKFILEKTVESAVVNSINSILLEAARQNASDVHFEPFENRVLVRFRIDGVLSVARTFPISMASFIVNRLKIMANLNIMETRLSQDGQIKIEIDNKNYDIRISCVPVSFGESVVLRLFSAEGKLDRLEDLGFSCEILRELEKVVNLPNGIVLFTGPTGSGKTTTMHALLEKMDKDGKKIITIEDPIEKHLDKVCQIQVNEEIGMTFENILSKVLRQDPNVIMIGEIRDKETAQLALRASLTGHLILATIHANDSVSVVERLKNFGLDAYLISCVLRLSVAQRLVRKLENGKLQGRTVIGEMFVVDSENEKKIAKGEKLFCTGKSLFEEAHRKVEIGQTLQSEILREGLA